MLINTLSNKGIKRPQRITTSVSDPELLLLKAIVKWRKANGYKGEMIDFFRLCIDNTINPTPDSFVALPSAAEMIRIAKEIHAENQLPGEEPETPNSEPSTVNSQPNTDNE